VLFAAILAAAAGLAVLICIAGSVFFARPFRVARWRLAVLLITTALPFLWFSARLWQSRQQRDAVARLGKAGCEVEYGPLEEQDLSGEQAPEHVRGRLLSQMFGFDNEAPPPIWERLLGIDFFEDVVRVDSDAWAQFTDTEMQCLDRLPHLRGLSITDNSGNPDAGVSDAGIEHLAGLARINRLMICCGSRITDRGLGSLANLSQLSELQLSGACRVTDAGLKALGGLKQLRILSLDDAVISDEG